MRKSLKLSVMILAFGLSACQTTKPSAGPSLTRAEITQAFEGNKMKVDPLNENWYADWTLHGDKMDVLANGSQLEIFSVKWEGDQMCLANMPVGWTAKGCYAVHSEGGAYILWKNGDYPYAKLTPTG